MKLDAALLRDFMNRFFGYGSWDAKLWFVGMEEGGGKSLAEITRRLHAWDGTDELAHVKKFHDEIALEDTDWFAHHPPTQPTWRNLIRVVLAASDRGTDIESVRVYQRDELGRDGAVALIELLPLPSPSTKRWLYSDADVQEIATRSRYEEKLLPHRIAAIRDRIAEHKPFVVVFYGIQYREYWEEIAGRPFEPVASERFFIAAGAATLFVFAPHPNARGVGEVDFRAIGKLIAPIIAAGSPDSIKNLSQTAPRAGPT